ncbi:hypothetical protein B0H19DRAFT_1069307 [Mycena capillaripes]|nr:hypothetical protein B0H19DRAFT_1069307 [Mycena capillaripes]
MSRTPSGTSPSCAKHSCRLRCTTHFCSSRLGLVRGRKGKREEREDEWGGRGGRIRGGGAAAAGHWKETEEESVHGRRRGLARDDEEDQERRSEGNASVSDAVPRMRARVRAKKAASLFVMPMGYTELFGPPLAQTTAPAIPRLRALVCSPPAPQAVAVLVRCVACACMVPTLIWMRWEASGTGSKHEHGGASPTGESRRISDLRAHTPTQQLRLCTLYAI